MPEWGEPIAGKGPAHDWNADDTLVATFDRTDEVDVADSDKPNGVRTSKIHRFIRDGGVFVDVWGSADLDGKIRTVEPGQLVRIIYLGKKEIGEGREMKVFTVQVDQSQVFNPAGVKGSAAEDDIPF